MLRKVVVVTVATALTLFMAQIASAASPRTSCPPGFDRGALTFTQELALPTIQLGLADGIYSVTDLQIGFDLVDANDNGLICVQDTYSIAGGNPNPSSGWQYLINLRDDSAAVPNSSPRGGGGP